MYPAISRRFVFVVRVVNRACTTDTKHTEYGPQFWKQCISTYESKRNAQLVVVGTGAWGSPKSVVLDINGARYLFNCGETVPRKLDEAHQNNSSLRSVFVTHLSWENTAGICSLALSSPDRKDDLINIHGPTGLEKLITAAEGFIQPHSMRMNIEHYNPLAPYVDSFIRVDYVVLKSNKPKVLGQKLDPVWRQPERNIDYYSFLRDRVEPSTSAKKNPSGPVESNLSVVLICQFKDFDRLLRKIILSKCVEFGVPPGPLIYDLYAGKDVILENGKIVKPSDVKQTEYGDQVMIVVECPSEDYLNSLTTAKAFQSYQRTKRNRHPTVIVHLTPSTVIKNRKYLQWLQKFPSDTIHIMVNDSNECTGYAALMTRYDIMHRLHPGFFPSLAGSKLKTVSETNEDGTEMDEDFKGIPTVTEGFNDPRNSSTVKLTDEISRREINAKENPEWLAKWGPEIVEKFNFVEGRTWTRYDFHRLEVIRCREQWWNENMTEAFLDVTPGGREAIRDLHTKFLEMDLDLSDKVGQESTARQQYPRFIFLGTAGGRCTKHRNHSSILMRVSEDKCILMDCGEGTVEQLRLFFDQTEFKKVLRSLRAIYISHLHSDHHLGLVGILKAQKQAVTEAGNPAQPLLLLAPRTISGWMLTCHTLFEPLLDNVKLVPLNRLISGAGGPLGGDIDFLLYKELDMKLVSTCFVEHCAEAYGVSFLHKAGWKITYSGDTMFSPRLVNIGKGSDLLIHEATFSGLFKDMARKKRHSTVTDAIRCGELMNARHVILTHFSVRYYYMPYILELIEMGVQNVSVSFDFMQASLQNLPSLPLLNVAYSKVFMKEIADLKENKYSMKLTSNENNYEVSYLSSNEQS